MKAELHHNMAAEQEVSQEQLMSDVLLLNASHFYRCIISTCVTFLPLEVSCLNYTLDKINLDW